MQLKQPLPHSRNQFLLLGYHKRLSNRPLFPLAFQQEALSLKLNKHHQIL
jgi:hypothetical protein